MTNSKKLPMLIANGRSEDVDEVMEIVARILVAIEPYLVRRVTSFDVLMDPEDFVANECEAALLTIYKQFLGDVVTFPLTGDHGDTDQEIILGWMKARIGKPYAGIQGGRVSNAIRREKNERVNTCPFEDGVHDYANSVAPDAFDLETASSTLREMLADVPARNAAIFLLDKYGTHRVMELTPSALAKLVSAYGVDTGVAKQVKTVAQALLRAEQKVLPNLNQKTIGSLFGVGPRQVRKIVTKVTSTLVAAADEYNNSVQRAI